MSGYLFGGSFVVVMLSVDVRYLVVFATAAATTHGTSTTGTISDDDGTVDSGVIKVVPSLVPLTFQSIVLQMFHR